MTEPKAHYLKDYRVPTHWIKTVALTIDLYEDRAIVCSTLSVEKNPENPSNDLALVGSDLVLNRVELEGRQLAGSEFSLTEQGLILHHVPDRFHVTIETVCNPQTNTSLMGLYRSGGNFCTQCESEGFRKITYYLDRPDVLAIFTVRINADKTRYPVLLSNGNLIDSGNLPEARHYAVWHDPFPKPSYLFAMVAGDLGVLEDHFTARSGRVITLRIFAAHNKISACAYAMKALKKAMRWDEEAYGREYDLDIFMIVAVNDFNFGAMENKGLNIFNDRYILVNSKTATDDDYSAIDAVVGHEYFHNWSGNRVTVRDWFQICLKEGFTVFREQSFSESVGLAPVERIAQVSRLRSMQFTEDAGPLAHPIRPESYIEMSNFYTATVYEKGAEVIRMLQTLLGREKFRAGADLYFSRYDGQAVTCDDFVQAMEDASGIDLSQFKRWYSQAGTPKIHVLTHYDAAKMEYRITLTQSTPATPGQSIKQVMTIPMGVGLLDEQGREIVSTQVISLSDKKKDFIFENIKTKPIPSLLRGFSAPVQLEYEYTEKELAFLIAHDKDPLARWEAGQQLAIKSIKRLMEQYTNHQSLTLEKTVIESFRLLLTDSKADKALVAEMFSFPEERYLIEVIDVFSVESLTLARETFVTEIANQLSAEFLYVYQQNYHHAPYLYNAESAGQRALKNRCLFYLVRTGQKEHLALALKQYHESDNMTDQFAAFYSLVSRENSLRASVIQEFYSQWKNEALVLDKWFSAQASARIPGVLDAVKDLIKCPEFSHANPNKARAVIGAFTYNFPYFHAAEGSGYEFLAEQVLILDPLNPMVAARMATAFAQWRRFDERRKNLMKKQMERILAQPKLSKDTYEILSKSLG